MVGASLWPPPPHSHHTNICKIFFTRVRCTIFKLGNFTKLTALFPVVFINFPNWSLSKVEKYLEGSIFRRQNSHLVADFFPHLNNCLVTKCFNPQAFMPFSMISYRAQRKETWEFLKDLSFLFFKSHLQYLLRWPQFLKASHEDCWTPLHSAQISPCISQFRWRQCTEMAHQATKAWPRE